jgi:hypothetical protein
MKIIKPKKRRKVPGKDQKKEAIFKQLSVILSDAGFRVRRERLKQGHGWKVASGSCSAEGENFVFVESRLSQDDQIGFLLTRIRELEVKVSAEQMEGLPAKFIKALSNQQAELAQSQEAGEVDAAVVSADTQVHSSEATSVSV